MNAQEWLDELLYLSNMETTNTKQRKLWGE